jgi:hypothetical protein
MKNAGPTAYTGARWAENQEMFAHECMTKSFGEKGITLNETPLSGSLPARASQGERGESRVRFIRLSGVILPMYFYGVLRPFWIS